MTSETLLPEQRTTWEVELDELIERPLGDGRKIVADPRTKDEGNMKFIKAQIINLENITY